MIRAASWVPILAVVTGLRLRHLPPT
jgi:hypothetical protein